MELSAASRRVRARAAPFVCAVAIAVLAWVAPGGAPAAGAPESRPGVASGALERLARSIADGPEGARADFASVSLTEMLIAYEIEFERLSVPGQVSRPELAKQARWATALRSFLDELYAARDALDAGESVEVLVSPPSQVQLLVGRRLVPLSSPRIDNPQALDDAIVGAYCGTFTCDPALIEEPAPAAKARAASGGWSFAAGLGSTYETVDGLGFMFSDVRRRSHKEQVCGQVRDELLRLAQALALQQRAGRAIDFATLRIEHGGRGEAQQVVLSASGARLRLPLPALARAPGVVAVAREWLRARASGRDYRQLFPRSDLLLAELMTAN